MTRRHPERTALPATILGLWLLAGTNWLQAAASSAWERLPSLPEPNGGFVCGAVGEKVVLAGGTNWKDDTKHWLDRVYVFERERSTWRDAGRLSAPLAYAAAGVRPDGLWWAGGSDGTLTHGSLSRLDRSLEVQTVAALDQHFVYASGAILDGKLYVVGGTVDQARLETLTNACFAIDLKTGRAFRIADLPVPGFVTGAAAACAGRVFVFGGAGWDAAANTVTNMNGVFVYSTKTTKWEELTRYPFAVRGLNAVVLDHRHIYVAGGYKNDAEEFTDEAFILDVESGAFRKSTPLPYRAMVGLVVAGDELFCLGGEDRKKHRTDAVWRIPWRELIAKSPRP